MAPWPPALLSVRGGSRRPCQGLGGGWSVVSWGPALLSVRGLSRRPWQGVGGGWCGSRKPPWRAALLSVFEKAWPP